MKRTSILIPLLLSAGAFADIRPVTMGPAFDWPVPAGWKKETIPFPLDFAPDLKHDGLEELRFAPDFFKPEAPGYWSYAFVWWLKDKKMPSAEALSDELTQYFKGLSMAVGGKKYQFDPARFRAEIRDSKKGYRGTADLYDAFTTGKPLSLSIEGRRVVCAAQDRRAVLFLLSPKPAGDPIWKELRERSQSFRCSPKG